MTEKDFFEQVANESWTSEDDDISRCVYCHHYMYRDMTSPDVESYENAAARIHHADDCPVLYARQKLAEPK